GHLASQRFTKNGCDAKRTLDSEIAFSPLDPGQECLVVAASGCKLGERKARFLPQLLQFHLSSPPMTTDTNLLPIVMVSFPMPGVNSYFVFRRGAGKLFSAQKQKSPGRSRGGRYAIRFAVCSAPSVRLTRPSAASGPVHRPSPETRAPP